MSDIKAGDLVMVVNPTPCCGSTKSMGRVFTVGSVEGPGWWKCGSCSKPVNAVAVSHPDYMAHDLTRLIRIDPPAQPEDVETPEELTA